VPVVLGTFVRCRSIGERCSLNVVIESPGGTRIDGASRLVFGHCRFYQATVSSRVREVFFNQQTHVRAASYETRDGES